MPNSLPDSRRLRVIGIDPGSRITGVGIVDSIGQSLSLVYSGVVKTGAGELVERLKIIHAELTTVIGEHHPDVMAVEEVFMARNARSALLLGHARGAAIVAGANAGLAVAEYSARLIKQSVVGRGAADKQQVQHMIRVLLGLTKTPPSDAADALACAICHIHTHGMQAKLLAGKVTA